MNQRRLEILLFISTTILIVSVVIIGVITYSNLRKIERHSEKIYQPNKIILTLKQLVSELRNSESSVRSYNLYRNDDFLVSYQRSVLLIDEYFDSLYVMRQQNAHDKKLLDSVHSLVEKKFQLLNEQLWIRDNLKVLNEINVINKKLDAVVVKDTISGKKGEQKKKRGLFSRLFNKKGKDSTQAIVADQRFTINKTQLTAVKKEVLKVKDKQAAWLEEMNERELALIEKDKVIMENLHNIMGDLEKIQSNKLREIAKENIGETVRTNFLLRVFGILFFVILTLSGILSGYYLYNGKKLQRRLNEAASEAKRLAETRQNFLSNMSHEMRTPLNSIVGFTEQMQHSTLNSQQREQVGIVNSSAQHLLRLVNNLLDKARIDAGKITIENIAFSPARIITECVQLVSVQASAKKLELVSTVALPEEKILTGDPVLLKQVTLNLLGNAIKFTEKGSVKVNASLKDEGDTAQLHLTIADTGIGIPADKQQTVFMEFEQADSSVNRKFGGTGLGLWITKKIIEEQHGKIELQSEEAKGTTVTVVLPFAKTSAADLKKEEIAAARKNGERLAGKKILVVDDEVYNRKLVSAVLRKYNVELKEAASGADALELLNNSGADVILADIHMPGMDGAQLTQIIRNNAGHNSKTPVIALTADLTQEKRKQYQEAGIDDFVPKPFRETELVEIILKNIENGKV